jgi:F-type H+-transporting ATPase subunit gamma
VVITSNRGLCGGYNAGLLRAAMEQIRRSEGEAGAAVELHVCGKKGISYFNFQKRTMASKYTNFEDKPQFSEVEPIAESFMQRYTAGEIDSVHVAYVQFESTTTQRPNVLQLLPMQPPTAAAEGGKSQASEASGASYDFTPPPAEILAELLPLTVKTRLFQCFTDAAVSEQVARMVAMKSATDAAGDMIKQLTRAYNRARQSQITLELLDIVGGAEAVK